MTQIRKPVLHNVGFNVPRLVLGANGRVARAGNPRMTITPGAIEPFEFSVCDSDGVPYALPGFEMVISFWSSPRFDAGEFMDASESEVILQRRAVVNDPASGTGALLLSVADTTLIGEYDKKSSVRWGVLLVGPDGPFMCSVASDGSRYGTVSIQGLASMPPGLLDIRA